MAEKPRDWKHAWEEPYLKRTDDHIFRNTFRDIDADHPPAGRRAWHPVRA